MSEKAAGSSAPQAQTDGVSVETQGMSSRSGRTEREWEVVITDSLVQQLDDTLKHANVLMLALRTELERQRERAR